jgi:hypothetical protein
LSATLEELERRIAALEQNTNIVLELHTLESKLDSNLAKLHADIDLIGDALVVRFDTLNKALKRRFDSIEVLLSELKDSQQ